MGTVHHWTDSETTMARLSLAAAIALIWVGAASAQPPTTGKEGGTPPTKKRFEDMTPDEQKADHDARMADATQKAMPLFVIIGLGAAGFLVNFVPTGIAALRGHNNTLPIFLVCLFLGWSCVGWVAALIWSFSDNTAANDNWKYRR